METFNTDVAGIDVHQRIMVVCVMTGQQGEQLHTETRTFGTMTRDLFEALQWLHSQGVTHIVMESTGVYWKPLYNIFEGYFEITLANAQRIKNVPGRKTDVSDAEWIAKLLRHGLIEPSFVPPEDIRELRELTRRRKKWVHQLTAEKNRIQKILECSNIKLGSVITDIFGVSERKLLQRLIEQGYVDKQEIDDCVVSSIKKKKDQLADSLFGTLTEHQKFMIEHSWDHIRYIEESIQKLDRRMDERLQAYQQEMQLLQTIPGVDRITAATLLAEAGPDMSAFPSAAHLSSWAGLSPGNNESAGKKSTRTVRGNPHIKTALCQAAWAASRCRQTRLSIKFWKLAARRGRKKALVAIAHKLLVIAYHMIRSKTLYKEPEVAS